MTLNFLVVWKGAGISPAQNETAWQSTWLHRSPYLYHFRKFSCLLSYSWYIM